MIARRAREPARARLPGGDGSRSSSPPTPRTTARTRSSRRSRRASRASGCCAARAAARSLRRTAPSRSRRPRSSPSRMRTAPGRPDALASARAALLRPGGRLRLRPARDRGRRRDERGGDYWRLETWLREQEAATGSITGGNGSIYAVRRLDYRGRRPALRARPVLSVPDGAARPPRRLRARRRSRSRSRPRDIEDEYARKVRMFEHCWAIVRRGRHAARPAARLPGEDRLSPPLRYGSGLRTSCCSGRASRSRAAAASTARRSPASSRSSRPRPRRPGLPALLHARDLGDGRRRSGTTCARACPPSGRRRRARGESGRGRRRRRSRARRHRSGARRRGARRSSSRTAGRCSTGSSASARTASSSSCSSCGRWSSAPRRWAPAAAVN